MKTAQEVRDASLAQLGDSFRVAKWLPLRNMNAQLRPTDEIATRLLAIYATFSWAAPGWKKLADDEIQQRIVRDGLDAAMTRAERAIVHTPRTAAFATYGDTIGWRLENLWPLAWVLGLPLVPRVEGTMIDDAALGAVLDFIIAPEGLSPLVARSQRRDAAEVIALEDLFYCAHNAGRSAQLGGKTVPADFHPITGTGVVHERRHALRWMLSPGVAWDETDLST